MEQVVKVARIYIHEAEHGKRMALVREILKTLRDAHCIQGATVFRGVAGFDEAGEVDAADMLRSFANLPEAVEFCDEPEKVEKALLLLKDVAPEGRTVVWEAVRR